MNRRIGLFRIIVTSIIAAVFIYLQITLVGEWFFSSLRAAVISAWLIFILAMILLPPLLFWTKPNRGESMLQVRLQQVCSWAQGYFSFLLFFVFLRDMVSLLSGFYVESSVLLVAPFAADLLGRIPLWLGPGLKRVKISSQSVSGLKIAQISDLHIGPGLPKVYVQRVVDRVNAQHPDIIALTGDIVDHLDKWFSDEIHLLKGLRAKHGIYYIAGNHEYYWGYHPIIKSMERMGFHVLDNKNVSFQFGATRISVCGVTDFAAAMFDMEKPDLVKARAGTESADFRILLAHQPKIADEASRVGFDLELSGHTHAGQFIPWSLMIRLFQKYPKGLYQIGKMALYVNQGTGFWGPPNRLGTWPEISLLEIGPL